MLRQFIKKFLWQTDAVAMIEFAFVLPFMMLLLFGAIEVTRYVVIVQKVEKSAYAMTNIVSQYSSATANNATNTAEINEARLNADVFKNFDTMMAPYNDPTREAVIYTSLVHRASDNANLIRWQIGSGAGAGATGTMTTDVISTVNGATAPVPVTTRSAGKPCIIATFPGDADAKAQMATALDGENYIVGEVFYHYSPILSTVIGASGFGFTIADHVIKRRFYMYPRNGDLLDLPAKTPISAGACPIA